MFNFLFRSCLNMVFFKLPSTVDMWSSAHSVLLMLSTVSFYLVQWITQFWHFWYFPKFQSLLTFSSVTEFLPSSFTWFHHFIPLILHILTEGTDHFYQQIFEYSVWNFPPLNAFVLFEEFKSLGGVCCLYFPCFFHICDDICASTGVYFSSRSVGESS